MKRLLGLLSCASLIYGLLLAGSATAAPLTAADSIRHIWRWPLASQLRLARTRLEQRGPRVAAVEDVVQRHDQRLNPTVYLELLGSLSGFYIHESQPSLAITKLLEVRQLAWADSARSANAAIWLSYCYQNLRQPQDGLAYGREAVRRLPRHAANHATELGQAYRILADCARLLPDYQLEAAYYRRALAVARQAQDVSRVAVALTYLAETACEQQQYSRSAALLDSARALYDARTYPALLGMEHQLAARLALHYGHYKAAERALAVLRPYLGQEPLWETDVLKLLVPALTGQGRYREALAAQQRLQTCRPPRSKKTPTAAPRSWKFATPRPGASRS